MTTWLWNLSPDEVLVFKGLPLRFALALLGIVVALALAGWFLQTGARRRAVKSVTFVLRVAAGALIVVAMTEPTVRRKDILPQQSFLAHVFDVSQSMTIEDAGDTTRLAAVRSATASSAPGRAELDRVYRSAEFAFSDELKARRNYDPLDSDGKATDLEAALRGVQLQTKGLPLSGVLLLSDGNATLHEDRAKILEAARDLQTPVYTVGCAPREPGADFWIEKTTSPDNVGRNVDTTIRVLVGARGERGRSAEIELTEAGRPIDRRSARSTQESQVLIADFTIRPKTDGVHHYHVKVSSGAHESYPWNNEDDFFVNVVSKKRRILHIEGYPRYEYRFLRAAFEKDERFHVTSVVHVTKESHIYRQGIENKDELIEGFPADEAELFGYDAVVIGDIASSRFTPKQLAMLREFVRSRGGALLFLGGKDTFAPGGFGDSPLADVLPFRVATAYESIDRALPVVPTRAGMERAMFGPYDPAGDAPAPWSALPPLRGLYPLHDLKPGATALCCIDVGQGDANPPVVAYQRYGRGTSLICGISATWPWKFRTPSDNLSHEAFWKEMILILMQGARERISVDAWPRILTAGGKATVRGCVSDAEFRPDPTAQVEITMETPDGQSVALEPRASNEEGFTFQCVVTPSSPGVYKIRARTVPAAAAVASPADAPATGVQEAPCEAEAVFKVRSDAPELREIRLNESLLREIAGATGGEYVHLSDYAQLPQLVKPREDALFRLRERPVWDKGMLFASILGLLLVEWLTRRLEGMA